MNSSTMSAQFQLESTDVDALSRFVSSGARTTNSKSTPLTRTLIVVFVGVLVAALMFKARVPTTPSSRYGSAPTGLPPLISLAATIGPIVFIGAFWFALTARGSNTARFVRMMGLLLVFAVFAGVLFKTQMAAPRYSRASPGSSPLMSLISLFLPMVLLVGFWWFVLNSSKKAQQKLPILQNPSTLTLSADAVCLSYNPTTTQTQWTGIQSVGQTPTHLFLLDQPNSAFIVPRRAFDSDEEFARFCDFARSCWQAYQPEVPPIARIN